MSAVTAIFMPCPEISPILDSFPPNFKISVIICLKIEPVIIFLLGVLHHSGLSIPSKIK